MRSYSSIILAVVTLAAALPATAQEAKVRDATDSTSINGLEKSTEEVSTEEAKLEEAKAKELPKLPPPAGAKAFLGSKHVWISREKKTVFVDGVVCLRQGMLEMFACPQGTKEHESVVAVYSRAHVLHTALLMIGAKSGTPVKFDEKFFPPTGDVIKIKVEWLDAAGKKHTVPAQQWVRDMKSKKAMACEWVFAGSGFWLDEETGKNHYMAEGGDLICVSNFSTAMLDVAVESTQSNDGLQFEAFAENVPALGTPVRLVMTAESKKKE